MDAAAPRRCANRSTSVAHPTRPAQAGTAAPTFAADEATTLLATAGFFQGVDVPGRTLIQVVIDRLPFPARTIRCCRRAASCSARPHSARSTCPGRR